ncbi:MAG: homocysteine S-methyltransferase family protein [Planctomycetota bacterium]|nr:MAG: homocysteine S-methyltransferase family protein [Planctomycetota bacterium]
MGTALEALGCDCSAPAWSARAVIERPRAVRTLHRAYVNAGAEVITACTFRTTPRALGDGWEQAACSAVRLALEGASDLAHVAGSIAPVCDCWKPELSPGAGAEPEHRALARVLADAGCSLLLCETLSHPDEAVAATRAAVSTGLEVWTALTAGYRCDLLTPEQLASIGRRAAEEGAGAVLVNCVPADRTLEYLQALLAALPAGVGAGCYANAGQADSACAGRSPDACRRYAEYARDWLEAGARIIGGCCGTWPEHIEAVARMLGKRGRGGIRTHE